MKYYDRLPESEWHGIARVGDYIDLDGVEMFLLDGNVNRIRERLMRDGVSSVVAER